MPGQTEKPRLSTTIVTSGQFHEQNPQVHYQGVVVTTHALFYQDGHNPIDPSLPADQQYKFRCPFMQTAATRGKKFCPEWRNAPCPYFCKTNVDLVRHEEGIHSDYRPNKCGYCSQEFKQKGQMQQHINAIHKNGTDQKRHQCAYCDKSFADPSALYRHVNNEAAKTPEQMKKTHGKKHYVKDDATRVPRDAAGRRSTSIAARRSHKLAVRSKSTRAASNFANEQAVDISLLPAQPELPASLPPIHQTGDQCEPGWMLDPTLMPQELSCEQLLGDFIDNSTDFGLDGLGELPDNGPSSETVADMREPPVTNNNQLNGWNEDWMLNTIIGQSSDLEADYDALYGNLLSDLMEGEVADELAGPESTSFGRPGPARVEDAQDENLLLLLADNGF